MSSQYTEHYYNTNFTLSLNSLKLSDAGEYNCSYYLTSESVNPFIKASDVRTGMNRVNIKSEYFFVKATSYCMLVFLVSNGSNPSIAPLKQYGIGISINLSCAVTYLNSSLNDVATDVNIQWLNSSNHTLHSYTGLNDYTEHTLNYTISNVKLSDAGQYTCQYNISSNNSFVITSDIMMATANVSVQS